jgi:hypothetical protein
MLDFAWVNLKILPQTQINQAGQKTSKNYRNKQVYPKRDFLADKQFGNTIFIKFFRMVGVEHHEIVLIGFGAGIAWNYK